MTESPNINPTPPSNPYQNITPTAQTQASNASTPYNAQMLNAVFELQDVVYFSLHSAANPPTTFDNNMLAQGILNFNNAYTSEYGNPPSGAPLALETIENTLTAPLTSGPSSGQSLLSLAQNNPAGLAPYFVQGDTSTSPGDTGALLFSQITTFTNVNGNWPAQPPGFGKNGPDLNNWQEFENNFNAMAGETPPFSNPNDLQNVAYSIVTMCNTLTGMENSGQTLDPAYQVLLWALTVPADSSGDSLESAAKAGLEAAGTNPPTASDFTTLSTLLTQNSAYISQGIDSFNYYENLSLPVIS
ncbi:MAG: hypothetical protein V4492_02015 [Chlamydiota bacterium]